MTHINLENRIQNRMDYQNFMEFTTTDLYVIARNISKIHGEQPSDDQIDEEIQFFYNN